MTSPLRVPVGQLSDVSLPAGVLHLEPEASRYVVKVHRKKTGERLLLFDAARGTQARATILSDRLPHVVVELEEVQLVPNQDMPVQLAVAIAKADKPEQAMRDVTQYGARSLVLLSAERSVARPESTSRAERLRRVAEQVARQCGRGRLPELIGPVSLESFLDASHPDQLKLVCAFHEDAQPLLDLRSRVLGAEGGVSILVGPEGGFSAQELALCAEAGCLAVDLGPYVLRAEVAAGAVLATLRAMFLAG